MKEKKILKFYFFAESLDRAFNNLILNNACAASAGGEKSAEIILSLLEEKKELGKLWDYIGGVISTLAQDESDCLKEYASLRCALKKLDGEKVKSIKRAAVKFARRARRVEAFREALKLVDKYYCLIN